MTQTLNPVASKTVLAPKAPGPNFFPGFLQFGRDMRGDALGYIERMRQSYGDLVKLPFPLFNLHQCTNPDLIGRLLLGTEKTNRKSYIYRRLNPLLGQGLLTSNGETWKRARRLSQPAFHPKVIQSLNAVLETETLKVAEQWARRLEKDETIDVAEEMSALTFTIIVKILFSLDLSDKAAEVREALAHIQDHANHLFYATAPLPNWVPTPRNLRATKALEKLNAIVYGIIAEHRKRPYNDLLSVYMQSRDEETGHVMGDQELRDEVITLMLAGHDTTATTLALSLDLLAKNPEKLRKLQAELDLGETAYVNLVMQEGMRLFPAAWGVSREMTEDWSHEAYHFPKGTTIIVPIYTVHRHPRYWDKPHDFIPERFQEAPKHPFAYMPFGGGQRVCIGSTLAKAEMQVILSTLCRRFDFAPVPGHSFQLLPRISLTVDGGVKLRVKARPSA